MKTTKVRYLGDTIKYSVNKNHPPLIPTTQKRYANKQSVRNLGDILLNIL